MRIGFDAKRIFFNQRGLGNYSRNLVRSLLKTYTGHQYHLYAPHPRDSELFREELEAFPNLHLRTPARWLPGALQSLWRSYFMTADMSSDRLDLYHGLSQELPITGSTSFKKVVTIHDLIFMKYPEHFSAMDRRIYTNKIKYACKQADLVIAISQATKNDLISLMKVKEQKIKVIYQSCDQVFYSSQTPSQNTSVNLQLPNNYVLYVGALVPHKNAKAILKAMTLMRRDDSHLVIVGSGKKYFQEMQTYIARHKLSQRVHFANLLGALDNQQLAALYRGASLFVFPSLLEGFGIPVIEAMFSGVPVIINRNAGLSEAAGEAAVVVDVNDSALLAASMDEIISDTEVHKQLVAKGESHVEKFKQEYITPQIMECYRQLVG